MRREIASPVLVAMVCIWEHVVRFHWPCNILGLQRVQELVWRGSDKSNVIVDTIEEVNKIVFRFVSQVGVTVHEVATPGDHQVISEVVPALIQDKVSQVTAFFVRIECCQVLVSHHGVYIAIITFIVPKAIWPLVGGLHRVGENLGRVAKGVLHGPPYPLHLLIGQALRSILVVHPGNEKGVESHVSKKTRVRIRVAKRIDVPADRRGVSEGLLKPLMARHHVIHHVIVVSAGLIMHRPARVHKLEAAFFDKLAHFSLLVFGLLVPPHGEELHLDLGEPLFGVILELNHVCADNVLNIGDLDILSRACEVFVDSFEPADIVVAMGDDVDEEVIVFGSEVGFQLIEPLLAVSVDVLIGDGGGSGAEDLTCKAPYESCLYH